MTVRIKKRAKFKVKSAACLFGALLAGPIGCAGPGKLAPTPKPGIQAKAQARNKWVSNQQKDTEKEKEALSKQIRSIESDLLSLQGEKALLELSDVLEKLAKLKGIMDISRLEPIGTEGWSIYNALKENLAGKGKQADNVTSLSEQAGSICSRIWIDFEKARQLAEIGANNKIEDIKKNIRRRSGNVIRRIRFRKEIDALRKKLSEMREERKRLIQLKGNLDALPESLAVDQKIVQSRKSLAQLRASFEEIKLLEDSLALRRKIKWFKGVKNAPNQ